jgi:hypothetical protein
MELDLSVFEDNLSTVTIEGGDNDVIVLKNAELIQQVHYSDGWYICFYELSPTELRDMEINAKLEYLAMMADVDLEEV